MKIAFRKKPLNWGRDIICWWTQAKHFHCELVFKNGLSFSADIEDFRTHFKTVQYDPEEWDFIEIPISLEAEYRIYDWCLNEDGCYYDIVGIFFTQIIPLSFQNPWWWFCSELCVAALQTEGLLLDLVSYQVDPGELYFNLTERCLKQNE